MSFKSIMMVFAGIDILMLFALAVISILQYGGKIANY